MKEKHRATVGEIRDTLPDTCTIWIERYEDRRETCLAFDENETLTRDYDDCEVNEMYPTTFGSVGGVSGIVIRI